jgi:hypothetical protein
MSRWHWLTERFTKPLKCPWCNHTFKRRHVLESHALCKHGKSAAETRDSFP